MIVGHTFRRLDEASERAAELMLDNRVLCELYGSPRERALMKEAIRTMTNTILVVAWTRVVENSEGEPPGLDAFVAALEQECDWLAAGTLVDALGAHLEETFRALGPRREEQ